MKDQDKEVTELKAKIAKLAKVDESKQELLTHQADQIRGMARGLENSKAKVMELEAKCILLDSEMANRCYECEVHKNEE